MYSYFENGKEGCEKLQFYSNIRDEFEEKYKIYNLHKISDSISRALCYIYIEKKENIDYFNNELCWYLYYWLSNMIYPLVQKNTTMLSKIIKNIYENLNDYNPQGFTVCSDTYYLYDLNRFNEYKLLFDYSKDYRNIEQDTAYDQTPCDEYYNNYINEYIGMYKKAHSECNEGKKSNFYCRNFFTLFQKKPYEKLSSFSCTLSKNREEILEEATAHRTQEHVQNQNHLRTTIVQDSVDHHGTADGSNLGKIPSLESQQNLEKMTTFSIDDNAEGGPSKSVTGSVVP
ncbi:CYIR protein, partial [Plasmodium cynomolgi strain B]